MPKPIGVFYEHPAWFEPMFAEFDRRGVPYERLLAFDHHHDPAERDGRYALLLNRMSPSAHTRGHGRAIPYTLHYLDHLEAIGTPVIGGLEAYRYEFSKARQLGLLARLGVRAPRAHAVDGGAAVLRAARRLTFPLVIKPNVGGSGAGIRRFDGSDELAEAARTGELDFGFDHSALLQEYHPPQGGSIVRVEVLGGRFLYAIRLRLETPDSFNLCPADYCRPGDPNRPVQGYQPPAEVIATVERIAREAGIEVGGVEYLDSERDGERYYYDINALSNFVADAPNIVGFDPFPKLVDFVLERSGQTRALVAG